MRSWILETIELDGFTFLMDFKELIESEKIINLSERLWTMRLSALYIAESSALNIEEWSVNLPVYSNKSE